MTYEEYLRNRLDRLNQNSHYGIMIDTEITDIVRSHIKRLEETKMNATSTEEFKDIIAIDFELQTFPNPDVQDKFIVSATNRDDIFAFVFEGPNIVDTCRKTGLFAGWEKDQRIKFLEAEIGRWKKEAADCLRLKDEAQKEAYKLKKENEKLTIEKAMLKDEKELGEWKKEASDCLRLRDEVRREKNKEINKLKQQLQQAENDKRRLTYKLQENENLKKKLSLEKAANEAQHKFIREYAGKDTEVQFNYAIDDTEEVSYVIVEKRCNIIKENEYLRAEMKRLREENKDAVAESLKYIEMNNKLQDENEELKYQLRDIQSTKEVVEQKLNTRDNVNHPSHYTGRYECIDVMQDVFGDEATNDFCLCNAFKYIWRARKKNGLEDVKKAVWYLNKYIEEAENGVSKGK